MEPWVRTVGRVLQARTLLPAVLAYWNGKPFNTAAISRELDVSRPTVVSYVRSMQKEGLARLLPFYGGGRRPLLVLSRRTPGLWMESIAGKVSQAVPQSRFFWWKTGRCRQVDFIAEMSGERIGFCFLESGMARRKYWIALEKAARRGVINRGFLLSREDRAFMAARIIVGLPIDSFMRELENWIFCWRSPKEIIDAVHHINMEHFARFARLSCLARSA